ncbi:MAG: 4-hydroxybenzoyl-CoA thioesterase [Gammaproteobacteria bacterium]|nr:MAG: 4-hydroxybenzoyl-CoA thioesterase [Gammaproteobacteria bacterium]
MTDVQASEERLATETLQGEYEHVLDFQVRDYECDLQGIVNNAVYQNYLEHARHQFLIEKGLDFVALSAQGINLVVIRVEIDYKSPLRAGDLFWLGSRLKKISRLKFVFEQSIYRSEKNVSIINAKVTGTSMNNAGRPVRFKGFDLIE